MPASRSAEAGLRSEAPKLRKSLPRGYIGPLVMASLAVAVALWAQSLARQPELTDALILFAAAAALLILASRRGGDGETASTTHEGDEGRPKTRPKRTGIFSSRPLARRLVVVGLGSVLLLGGAVLNLYALSIFGRGATNARPWLVYLPSVALGLAGLWVLSREQDTGETASPAHQYGLSRWREVLLAGAIVLVGAFFRLYHLNLQPAGLFYDEAMLGMAAERVIRAQVFPVFFFEANSAYGAFSLYLSALFVGFLGSSAFTLRLVSAAIGILTIPALYVFVRQLFGPRTALVAALLLAVSRWHTNFSRVAFDAIAVPLLELIVFYFLVKGMRTRRMMDFVWAGVAAGLGLNTYAAFRLVPFIAAFYVLYRVVAERRLHHQVVVGLGALLVATLLVVSPLAELYLQNPQVVGGRTETVSVFAGKSREAGIQAAIENARKHLLMFNREGDHNGRHNLPGEPMLDYVTGALFVVGFGYSLFRVRRSEYAFFLVWFLVMLAAGVFSLDFEAPQALRAIGTIPVAIVFAALTLDRLLRLGDGQGRAVTNVVAAGVILLLGSTIFLNYTGYFVRQATNYASWNDFSTPQALMAKEMRSLGADWQYYVTSIYYEYPTVRFLAPGITGYRRIEATDALPIREGGDKNVAIFLDTQKANLFADAKRYYPNATFKEYKPPFGGATTLFEVQLHKEDIQSVQGLIGRYYAGETFADAPKLERRDAAIAFDWEAGTPLPPPFGAEWSGTLYVASYGPHLLGVRSPGAVEVWLDETLLLRGSGEEQTVRLARGNHSLRVRAVVPQASGHTELYWQPAGGGSETIPTSAFYAPPVSNNGLLGSYFSNPNWAGEPALQQIDPSLSLYFHNTPLPRPYSVEWQGKVNALTAGDYRFGLESIDDSWLEIDGRKVVEAHVANRYEEGRIRLDPGWHDLRLRYVDKSGWSHINLFWTPPGRGREIIPAERLLPLPGGYLRAGEPPATSSPTAPSAGPGQPPAPQPEPQPTEGVPVSGGASLLLRFGGAGDGPGQLQQPKDLALAPDGTIYVADTGNGRVMQFDAGGGFIRQIGVRGPDPGQFMQPLALALTPDGDLLVLDEDTQYVSRFAPDGTFRGRFGGPEMGFYHPRAITVGPDNIIYVADSGRARVVVFSPEGNKLRELGGKGKNPGQVLGPVGLAVDAEGMLWLADVENNRVQRLSPDGQYLGSFEVPLGESVDGAHLALGAQGLYLSDPVRNQIVFYSFDGKLLGNWGEAGEGDGQLRRPVGIAVDRAGSVWVVERDNHRVQKFRPPG